MARLPASIPDLVEQFGPHLNREPAGGWTTRGDPDRIVPTHCCFCGQQCGIQLKVKDEKIVGFEPWEEFPFNKGKLCPTSCSTRAASSITRRASRTAGPPSTWWSRPAASAARVAATR